jgi:hypothetical protein
MSARVIGIMLVAAAAAACATTLPPEVPVASLAGLAGTYSGTLKTDGSLDRSTRLVLKPDGDFELMASDPSGFRTLGTMTLGPDGALRYRYKELRGGIEVLTGRGKVHEGDGKRALVLTQDDGKATNTVWKDLP